MASARESFFMFLSAEENRYKGSMRKKVFSKKKGLRNGKKTFFIGGKMEMTVNKWSVENPLISCQKRSF
jgi:hypothetical protein